MDEKTSLLENWDFDKFVSLTEKEQFALILAILEDQEGEILSDLTETDEFSAAQAETNGTMFVTDEVTVRSVKSNSELKTVAADFDFSASAMDEASDLGGTLPISGCALLVIESDGSVSLEEVEAHAVYPDDDELDDDDFRPPPESLDSLFAMDDEEDVDDAAEEAAHSAELPAELHPSEQELTPLSVYVDPGAADPETVAELFLALSAAYSAMGGSGLEIVDHGTGHLVTEEVAV